MEIFIARQPIFDCKERVLAYELLFRQGMYNQYCENMNGDQATSDVIANSFLTIGMQKMTGGRRAFINFTTNLIKNQTAHLLPSNLVVIEILEDIEPSRDIIAACQKLKEAGYIIALDDFILEEKSWPFINLADIIKVDFMKTPGKQRYDLVNKLSTRDIIFLAEKIETREEFEQARQAGYTLFQGFFFSKPSLITHKRIPPYKTNILKLWKEVNSKNFSFKVMEDIIKGDISLSYNLLKYINSSAFGLKVKVNSIKQGLVLMGLFEVKKWISLVTLQTVGRDKPVELIANSLVRAFFGEALALKAGLGQEASNSFFMGMFSLMDVFLDRPLAEILDELPLKREIKQVLLGNNTDSHFAQIFNLILAYEKADWFNLIKWIHCLGLDEAEVSILYYHSLIMANQLALS